jgi:hypothetical protein
VTTQFIHKEKNMLKRLTILGLVVFVLIAVVRAQDATPTPTPAILSQPAQREIYTVLQYGDGVFEPELWFASAAESAARTTATFSASKLGGVAYIDYLHYDKGLKSEEFDAVFNDAWFKATLANYQTWTRSTECNFDAIKVHEFNLENNNLKYVMRYWIAPATDTRILTLFIVFPSADTGNLDAYSKRIFPEAAACPK